MRKGQHGISQETAHNLLIDAGKVVLNYGVEGKEKDLGATLGGNTFRVEDTWKDIRPDGAPGKIKGLRRRTGTNISLVVNMFEWTKDNILLSIPGAEAEAFPAEGSETHQSIKRNRDITLDDYFENVALIGTLSGSDEPVIIIIENGLSDNGLEIGMTDKEEAATELTISAHYNPDKLEEDPFEIRHPLRSV